MYRFLKEKREKNNRLNHDTHVCGIIAGNGNASKGRYRGIAPECNLICAKVLDEKGGGKLLHLLHGMEWLIALRKELPIRIINLSIEIDDEVHLDKRQLALLHKYMKELVAEDVVIVAAAGNSGPRPMSISPISDVESCICVGCFDEDYVMLGKKTCADYSGRGPGKKIPEIISRWNNPLKKPDLVAPGTDIMSCHYKTKYYIPKSGTSMATPIVTGAIALCMQKYPTLTSMQIRQRLQMTAKDLGYNWGVQGAGVLQVDKLMEDNIN